MKKTVLLLAISMVALETYSQSSDDVVNYALEEDDPNINYIGGGINVLEFTLDNRGSNIGCGGTVIGQIGKFGFNFNTGLGTGIFDDAVDISDAISIYSRHMISTGMSGNIRYGIVENTNKEDIRIHLKSSGNTSYVTDIPGTVRTLHCVDLGFSKGTGLYSIDFNSDAMALPYGSSTAYPLDNFASNYLSTNYHYTFLKFGYSRVKMHDLVINADGYGIKRSRGVGSIYGHLVLGLNGSLEDVAARINQSSADYYQLDVTTPNDFGKLGFDVGTMFTIPKIFGGYYGAELGYMPGPKLGFVYNTYFRFFLGFTFTHMWKN